MAYTVRRCDPRDAPVLALLGQATFYEAFCDVVTGPDLLDHCQRQHSEQIYADWLTAPNKTIWLGEHATSGAALGYAALVPPELPEVALHPDDLELKRIYTLWRTFGSGLAQSLLEITIDHARTADAKRLLLGVYEDNRRAIAFYERNGFRKIGARTFSVGAAAYSDWVMARQL